MTLADLIDAAMHAHAEVIQAQGEYDENQVRFDSCMADALSAREKRDESRTTLLEAQARLSECMADLARLGKGQSIDPT